MPFFIYGGLYLMKYKLDYQSPIGTITIMGTEQAIQSIMFSEQDIANDKQKDTPKVLMDCYLQLDEYFKGERKSFTFPYTHDGTEFQRNVWNALVDISYGTTCSYKELASRMGKEKAIRAVGAANGKNQLSIVVPCHRVIGSNGELTGYAGRIWRKQWLIQHEQEYRNGK